MPHVPSITLNNGVQIPSLGFGVFQIPPDDAQAAVESALELGYRHIDTAAAYRNESGVGAAIAASGISRSEIFVTTKLRNGNQGYDEALAAFADSKARLAVDYVDLYLIHWPSPARDQYVPSWKALERLNADGEVRSIGVSNFLNEHLDRLHAESGIVPAVDQIELHPTFQQAELVATLQAAGIAVESYSPLGQGADLDSPVVEDLAQKYSVTPAQIVLRWHLQRGFIAIPKSVDPGRMAANIDVFGFELSSSELALVTSLERGYRVGADPRTAEFSQI